MAKIVSHHLERDQVPGLISRPSSNEQPGRWCLPRRHWGTAPSVLGAKNSITSVLIPHIMNPHSFIF